MSPVLNTSISGMDEGVEYKANVSWDILNNAAGHITEQLRFIQMYPQK